MGSVKCEWNSKVEEVSEKSIHDNIEGKKDAILTSSLYNHFSRSQCVEYSSPES